MGNTKIKFGFASDHAGFEYKEALKKYVENKGFEVVDLGPFNEESSSYAVYGQKLGQALKNKEVDLGIAVCGTGLGMSYALNRIHTVRAARVATVEDAHLAKLHNNANVLTLGQRTNTLENAKAMVDEFIKTEFEGGRHKERIDKLDQIETCADICTTDACATDICATNACATDICATNACATDACATDGCTTKGCREDECATDPNCCITDTKNCC
ncbi:ribose 5-phosphate isomerase B [Mycoplasma iguanae]|uniref:ribose 5-phosphate isomerase B n=1 Tax=Mycoplasma iguanae TaxID=292461 RepID=UPI00358DF69E